MNSNPMPPTVSSKPAYPSPGSFPQTDWPVLSSGSRIFFPPSLASFLHTLRATPLPLCLAWGPELTLYFNTAFRPLSAGNYPADPFGKPAAEVFKSCWEEWEPLFSAARNGEVQYAYGFEPACDDDGPAPAFDITFSPFYNEQGIISGVLMTSAERFVLPSGETMTSAPPIEPTPGLEAMLEAQRESERRRLFDLFMQAPSPIAILRGREGFCELVNPLFQKVFGDRPMLHKYMREAIPELEGQVYFPLIEYVYDTGEPVQGNEAPVVADWKCDGHLSEAYFNFVFTPYRNAANEVEGVMIFGFEVTEQKRSGQAIRDSEERFRSIADTAPVMIWMSGTDKQCYFFNQEWQEFTGRTLEQENGSQWQEGIHPDDRAQRREIFCAAFAEHSSYDLEFRLRRHDGRYRWVSDRGRPRFAPDGTFLGYIGGCMDVHEVKMAREELERRVAERTQALQDANADLRRSNQDLEQFAYVASHDLQEPLRKIRLFSDRLTNDTRAGLDESSRSFVDKIAGATDRMSEMIDDLLGYSRLARRRDQFEATNLNTILTDVLKDFDALIRETQAVLKAEPLPIIEAIPAQMRELFYQLLDNSLKFSRAGLPPVVRINSRPLPAEAAAALELNPARQYCELSFTDNGIGFRQEFAEQIFTIFQRLNARHEYSGTGIGLAVCRKIAVNHEGGIWAESDELEGTRVRVVVPVEQG